MAPAELTIHRLRLGPAAPPMAARLAVQLGDALRTSSKPAALLHRHVLVRRLRLRLPRAASAQGIAAQLEQAWQRIAALAVPLDQAVDADDAVWAPSEPAARAALVRRWVRGEVPTAWFWQRIARPAGDAAGGAWPQRALRLMRAPLVVDGPLGATALPGDGPVPSPAAPALRPVLQALAEAGLLPRLAVALTAAEARQLMDLIEAQALVAGAVLPLPLPTLPGTAPAASVPTASAGVLLRARQLLQARLGDAPLATMAAAWSDASASVRALPRAGDPAAPTAPLARQPTPPDPDATAAAVPCPGIPATAVAAPLDAIDTAWAGLWLLLPVLLRCGLEAADAPLVAFAQALQAAPGALHIPGDDPVHGLIAALDLPPADATGPWLRRARLAALRDARLPLRRIALRRGTVHVSELRLDVVFPLRAADVRIRRAGFDLDPGFVPWLGRIVHVHYAG
ncbi:MAG TPA: hypothetical protein PKL46_01920 [Aquabacterium sp.]|nr:hypothetical protein [Aquabacterium sp.]